MEEKKKVWLNEVSFMRPILLVLLVSYHAFAPYCGAWAMPEGIQPIESYKWIALFSRAFRLEAFVFISGYIFTFQLLTKNKFHNVWNLSVNKAKRLLVPCVFFGTIYYLCFQNIMPNTNPVRIFAGIGHLWYLPCLFWLFIAQYLVIKSNVLRKRLLAKWKLVGSVYVYGGNLLIISVLPVLSVLPFPLQLNRVFYYILFFYGGGLFYQYSDKIAKKTTVKSTVLLWCLFIVMVFLLNILMENNSFIASTSGFFIKIILKVINIYLKISLAWVGITALYQTAVIYCRKHIINKFLLNVGVCGYGVYIFHQFILVHIYDQTNLPQVLGTYLMPWISMIFTIAISVILTLLVRETKLGKMYL